MERERSVLVIAGSDSGGGAGIQADTWAIRDQRVFVTTALTAVTAQDTRGVRRVDLVSADAVRAQIATSLADNDVAAVKIGMLGSAELVAAVVGALQAGRYGGPIVVDPVMVATSGDRLLAEDAAAALQELLLPLAAVITPNQPEARVLAGGPWEGWARGAAMPVLVTGGDADTDEVIDELWVGGHRRRWVGPRLPGGPFHGTGCTLSSALAAGLALGEPLEVAVDRAIRYVRARLASPLRPGRGALVGGWFSPPGR